MDSTSCFRATTSPEVQARHLNESTAVFEAMLEGWEHQQRSRFLGAETIVPRVRLLRRFAEFAGQ
ncbi:MAG TPA: hypothetical protein VHC18_15740 [Amycolatopsis sp.]|nr:hypothetical protein [Amycolatopsis sp.]